MVNKKAQDLSIGTLILIVLGIIVLVLLILGFSMGWSNLWDKINIFQGGSNVESVIQSCNLVAASNAKYTYCEEFKKIKINSETEYINCQDLRIDPSLDKKITCDTTSAESAKKQCISLINANTADDKTKVNGNVCSQKVSCADIGGTPSINGNEKTKGTCSATDKTVEKGIIAPANNNVCCITQSTGAGGKFGGGGAGADIS